MVVNTTVEAPDNGGTGTRSLDFQLLDLNEDQSIEAPSGAKPFDQLLGQLGGLGLGGAAPGAPALGLRRLGRRRVRGGPQEVLRTA